MDQVKLGFMKNMFGGINTSDKVFLTKYLALMLRVGTDLLSAINILIVDFDKPVGAELPSRGAGGSEQGPAVLLAFARHPKDFSPTVINLVKAAEGREASRRHSKT